MGKKGIVSGCNLMSKFVRTTDKAFAKYIDYIDRDNATRNEHYNQYSTYVDYVGNPEKTTDLFTEYSDSLSEEEKINLKKDFMKGQELGNPMWQTVISFDMDWLSRYGIYNADNGAVDSVKLMELTRNSMKNIIKSEKMEETAIWSASIHYNTKHIHVHIATIEPTTSSRPLMENGEVRGKWKQKSLEIGKSTMVNGIINQRETNLLLSDLRQDIIKTKHELDMTKDNDLRNSFFKVYASLPSDRRYWNYNSTKLGNRTRYALDELSRLYLGKYCSNEYREYNRIAHELEEEYILAYGQKSEQAKNFASNKEQDLVMRVGNAILSELRDYDKELKAEEWLKLQTDYLGQNLSNVNSVKQPMVYENLNAMNNVMRYMNKSIKAFIKKDLQSLKNMQAYQKLELKIKLQNQGYDVSHFDI